MNNIPTKIQSIMIDEFIKIDIILPTPSSDLQTIFSQLRLFSKQRLNTFQSEGNQHQLQQIKGLKFISSKLARLFIKNRKLPYNQISKILISNFAAQQKDQRNIKRRVYDAINVLISSGILIKKNNHIEMINNKIKNKIQYENKDNLLNMINLKYKQINKKTMILRKLNCQYQNIKRLFNRNIQKQDKLSRYMQNNLNKHKQLKSDINKQYKPDVHQQQNNNNQKNKLIKNKLITKTEHQNNKNKQNSKNTQIYNQDIYNLSSVINQTQIQHQTPIYQPGIFILFNQSETKHQIITNFHSSQKLQILAPHNPKNQFDKYTTSIVNKKNQDSIEQEINYYENVHANPNNHNSMNPIQKLDQVSNGTYSLLDLLQFLSLNPKLQTKPHK